MKILLNICLFFLSYSIAYSQCSGNLEFTTQAQVDAFATNYNCSTYNGNINIQANSSITNLDGFMQLETINGSLFIINADVLTNIEGLQNLESITNNLSIRLNDVLPDLSGLNSLNTVGGLCFIEFNPALQSLDALNSLTSIGGILDITGNLSLQSIEGLSNLTSVGELYLANNSNLNACCAVLNFLTGTITVLGNAEGCESVLEISETCGEDISECNGDIVINSQAQLDDFILNYPCTQINGSLTIATELFPPITDLTPLANIDSITGDLNVLDNPISDCCSLFDIGVGGNVNFANNDFGCESLEQATAICLDNCGEDVILSSQAAVDDFVANANCTLYGFLTIEGDVVDVSGLDFIEELSGGLAIQSTSLTDLTGLGSIGSVGGGLLISNNTMLPNLDGLLGIESIGGSLQIIGYNALTNIDGLSNVNSLGSSLIITNNPNLNTCCSILNFYEWPSPGDLNTYVNIENNGPDCNATDEILYACLGDNSVCTGNIVLESQNDVDDFFLDYPCLNINGSLTISDFSFPITDISTLSNLTSISGDLIIQFNDNLSVCCASLDIDVGGNTIIQSNGFGCESVSQVNSFCNGCGGDIIFTSQAEVNAFGANLNCPEINNLFIEGADISDLTPLNSITTVEGNVNIQNNPLLNNLSGLENLATVDDLFINNNPQLVNLNGLEGLTSVQGNLDISNNAQLNSLESLSGLNEVSFSITINGNGGILNLNGLNNLTEFDGTLNIMSNPSLISVSGIEGITTISTLFLFDNQALLNLEGFSNVENINSSLIIQDNASLNSLNGLENITALNGGCDSDDPTSLAIVNNDALTNLSGLDNLEYLGCHLEILDNDALENVDVLSNLTTIDAFSETLFLNGYPQQTTFYSGSITITNNAALTSLAGLDNLASVGYDSSVPDNIDSFGGAQSIIITNNESLEICCFLNLIEFSGTITIENNAPSCDSPSSIFTVCGVNTCSQDFVFTNQFQIDDFSNNFCGIVDGSITIETHLSAINQEASTITDLSPLLESLVQVTGDFNIINNPSLNECCLVLDVEVGGTLTIENNGTTCNHPEVLEEYCGGCSPDITLNSQAEVDAFPLNYDCTVLNNLHIEGSDITDLSPLNSVIGLMGYLIIHSNTQLTSLEGLDNLTYVGNFMSIYNNPLITDLSGLSNLTAVYGNVGINENNALLNLEGLSNLTNTGGYLKISYNNSLISVDGLDSFSQIGNYLDAYNLAGNYLEITGNASLINVDGFSNLTSIIGGLLIKDNPILANLNGFLELTDVDFNFIYPAEGESGAWGITSPPNPLYLEGVVISGNSSLTDLQGLNNLTNVFDLIIDNNASLTSLNGLNGLEFFNAKEIGLDGDIVLYGPNVIITNNPVLQNINALSDIFYSNNFDQNYDGITGRNINIVNNPLLEICCSITDFWDTFTGDIAIENNAIGCNSAVEVENTCDGIEDGVLLIKVILEGAYYQGNMSSNLVPLLPNAHPYSGAPWDYSGNESLTNFPPNVVDWVLVEVRAGTPSLSGLNTTVVERQAALLLDNTNIVDIYGNNGLVFNNLNSGESYHIVVRHRNHLDVFSSNPIIGNISQSYDFTQDPTAALGIAQLKDLGGGNYGLHAGDFQPDGVIQTTDYDLWFANSAGLNVYAPTDANLDGVSQVTDYDKWFENKAKIGVPGIGF